MAYDDDDYDAYDEYDYDVDEDADEEVTLPCPSCGEEIPEDAPYCPYCHEYLTAEDFSRASKPWWLWPVVIACLAALLGMWRLFV